MSIHTPEEIGQRLWRFHGGLQLRHWKQMSLQQELAPAPLPDQLIVPVAQQIGSAAEIAVSVGEQVRGGQPLTVRSEAHHIHVHAPSSGVITAIEERPVIHARLDRQRCVVIEVDGEDQQMTLPGWPHWHQQQPEALRDRLAEAGVAGLGGALFPTHVKLADHPDVPLRLLIINGAECEPYIAADESLMRWRAEQVLLGALVLSRIVAAEQCVIAIEDQMGVVEVQLRQTMKALQIDDLKIIKVPTLYPEGGERQLIRVLTGLEVPAGGLPQDLGIVVQNVGTAAASYQAVVDGQPLISRVVSVTGHGVHQPVNLEARIGTLAAFLIEQAGGYTERAARLVMGGPLMGISLPDDQRPLTKAGNCLLTLTEEDIRPVADEMPCIRCGKCSDVCPARLLPQELLLRIRGDQLEEARSLHLNACIECGCCDLVCPSQIPLTAQYRQAKHDLAVRDLAQQQADLARDRHEFRQQRLEAQHARRRQRLEARRQRPERSKSDEIKAAIARARDRKKSMAAATDEPEGTED